MLTSTLLPLIMATVAAAQVLPGAVATVWDAPGFVGIPQSIPFDNLCHPLSPALSYQVRSAKIDSPLVSEPVECLLFSDGICRVETGPIFRDAIEVPGYIQRSASIVCHRRSDQFPPDFI
ncbi:hypothetical protein S7711_10634 [Stachybotrys chartarum IBT 7711]|uniref:Uncharacterized protein n=1 Tax=Stachybotrys chartarum (strain CBS 109288 / IBT 7711) TaxID=1280523 RepID=A0A084AH55_STACB|nr:hypothetical protein S7711_10634 [Stachybotrys chartarum IBT 7711]KFA56302.1 hypothetical protein S40293_10349 [Stachybotrys chartarum IBT 40293]KFA72111.1 hypothetical protein S40288_10707 [Stachybotrys chartarum IBT 40288]